MGSEKCAIKIKSNALVGYTFYETTYIQHIQELDNLLKPIKEFNNTKKAIINYIRKYEKYIQIIPV